MIADPGADGEISLREAITAANATDGLNTINFDIAGSGPHIINLAAELPEITGTLVIDGTSEPDFSGSPVIGINGFALTNDDGFRLMSGSEGSTIRGLAVAYFSDGDAFDIRTDYNTIVGNHIGLATDGVTAAGNDVGVKLHNGADFNTIGGTDAADRNLISGNSYAGVVIKDNNTNDNRIIGNWIGLDRNGDVVSAGDHGVVMWDGVYNNQVGGVNPGEGNRIAGHNNGVVVDDNGAVPLDNAILGNEIFSVNEMAIDLDNEQVTANDAGDGDSGPNDLLNYPVLNSVVQDGADLDLVFNLDVPAGDYRIEFFENPAGISGIGLGEGQVFLGAVTVTHPGGGSQSFSETLTGVTATATDSVTATATEDLGGGSYGATSEFGPATAPDALIKETGTPIVADGVIDAAWASATQYNINQLTVGSISDGADLSGTWRSLWDDTNLYVLYEVNDNFLINDSGSAWQDDAIELFIDPDFSRGTTYDGVNDYQLFVEALGGVLSTGINSVADTTGINGAVVTGAGGYLVEMAIPWATLGVLPTDGALIGFDAHISDDDNGGGRDAKLAWHDPINQAGLDPSMFGVAQLIGIGNAPVFSSSGPFSVNEHAAATTRWSVMSTPTTAMVAGPMPVLPTESSETWTPMVTAERPSLSIRRRV